MAERWEHDSLASDLRAAREGCGEVAVVRLALGPWGGDGQMDVLAFRASRSHPRPTCYEAKVSRADFLADVRAEKFRRYEPWSECGYFAVPAGMVAAKEVPTGWGLLQRGANGWYSTKRPQRRPMTAEYMASLLMAVHLARSSAPWRRSRAERLRAMADADLWLVGRTIGGRVHDALSDNDAARRILARALGITHVPEMSLYGLALDVSRRVPTPDSENQKP